MRNLDSGLRNALNQTTTTLCHCWKLTRRDGYQLGFTDHDRDITLNGTIYNARSGFDGTQVESALGLTTGSAEVAGALSADDLREVDLACGLYDGASVETWLVDWSTPQNHLLLDVHSLGELRRSEFAFTAELRSLAHEFDQERGRLFQSACSADLGDARCGVELANAAFRTTATVASSTAKGALISALGAFATGWFTNGRLTFTSGANSGAKATIKQHENTPEGARLTFWTPMAQDIAPSDAFTITAGCDKSFATCKTKFSNRVNFRGFPHMPGNDFVISTPGHSGAVMDGGSLFK